MDTTVNNYPERFLTYLEVEKIVLSIRLKAIKRIWLPLRSLCCAETSRIFSGSRQVLWMCVAISQSLTKSSMRAGRLPAGYLHYVPFLNTLCVKRLLNIVR